MLFALIATIANIGAQEISMRVYGGEFAISCSIIVGTIIGLIVKYFLDKRYIFCFFTTSAMQNAKIFLLYSVMGVVTTLMFWGFEYGFHYFFQTKEMRYFGAVIGLIFGYVFKYRLDKKFVFK